MPNNETLHTRDSSGSGCQDIIGDARGAVVDSDLSPGTGPRARFCHSTSDSDVHLQKAEPEYRLKGVFCRHV